MQQHKTAPGYTIDLTRFNPIAEGKHRLVYQHPDRPDRLVKVLKPHLLKHDGRIVKKKLFRIPPRQGNFIHFAMDFTENLAVRVQSGAMASDLPVSAVYGIEDTTAGIGLVVEKVTRPDGALAPTLKSVLEAGEFDDRKRLCLDRFFDEMIRYHVVIYEISLENILYREGPGGDGRFVCVDGLGCRTLIPLPVWFKTINTRKLQGFRRTINDQISDLSRHRS